jgi:SAM-dependent methyltransferase
VLPLSASEQIGAVTLVTDRASEAAERSTVPLMGDDWQSFLDRFHREQPGVTERILDRCHDAGLNPYDWVAQASAPDASVLDLGCGSAPLYDLVVGDWVGLDRSPAELERARRRGASAIVLGDATRVPVAACAFDTVVSSMTLMLVQPLPDALREIRRVLRPGGRLVAMLPASSPRTVPDRLRSFLLLLALRRRLAYPNDAQLSHPEALLARAGFTLLEDQRRRFAYELTSPDDARELVTSLYLPGLRAERLHAALTLAQRAAPTTIGISLRRLIATVANRARS